MIGRATGEDRCGEIDLAPAHERWLGEWARRKHGSEFLFVTGYPMAKRPFYTHPDPVRPRSRTASTCCFGGWRWCTGGQRLHRYQDYLDALAARGADLDHTRGTCRHSNTACRHTAGSRSAWRDSSRACRRNNVRRPRSFRGISIGSRRRLSDAMPRLAANLWVAGSRRFRLPALSTLEQFSSHKGCPEKRQLGVINVAPTEKRP